MPINRRVGPYPERSFARQSATYSLRFTAAGVTPCTGVVQDEGLVTAATGVTRTGAGTYVITLNQRFMRIHCDQPNLHQAGDKFAKVTAVVEGAAAANTITIEVWDISGGAATDPAGGATVELNFRVVTSAGD